MAATIQSSIRRLAVSYAAYGRASDENDRNGIIVWAEELIEAQQITGVVLHDEAHLSRHIAITKRAEARANKSEQVSA
jgi:hypothetical protein